VSKTVDVGDIKAVLTFTLASRRVVTFDASGSKTPPGVDIVQYDWNFGCPSCSTQTTTPATPYEYPDVAATYAASVTITDSNGHKTTSPAVTVKIEGP
jgi:hypothetical protein